MDYLHAGTLPHVLAGLVVVYVLFRLETRWRKRREWKRWAREAKTKVYRARRE